MGNEKSVATLPGAFPEDSSAPSSPASASRQLAEMTPASPPAPASEETGKRKKKKNKKKNKKKKKKKKQQQQQQQQVDEAVNSASNEATTPTPAPPTRLDPLAAVFTPALAPTPAPIIAVPEQTRDPFDFGRPLSALQCRLPGCEKQTRPDDGESVACPACSVASLVRYCCKQHLYDDLRTHWLFYCSRFPVSGPLAESTVAPVRARQPRPYLSGAPSFSLDTIEHHRQAVYFAMEGDNNGDYFLFADSAALALLANPSDEQIKNCRGTGKLVARISLPDHEDIHDHRKQRFRTLVTRCLIYGATTEQGMKDCIDLAAMIQQELVNRDEWNDEMITHLAMGMKQEFGFQLPESMQ